MQSKSEPTLKQVVSDPVLWSEIVWLFELCANKKAPVFDASSAAERLAFAHSGGFQEVVTEGGAES